MLVLAFQLGDLLILLLHLTLNLLYLRAEVFIEGLDDVFIAVLNLLESVLDLRVHGIGELSHALPQQGQLVFERFQVLSNG